MKVRFSDLFLDETKNGFKIKAEEYLENGKYPIVDQGNNNIAGYTNLEKGIFENIPVIIFGDHTRVIKYIDMPFFLGADGVKILKIKLNNVLPKYLFYYLKNVNIPDTGYNRHFKWLKELNFEIPNLKIQNNIVNILDRITTIISLRQRQLKKLDELVKSRFIEMFDNKKRLLVKMKDVCDFITKGATPNSSDIFNVYSEGVIPYIKVYNLSFNGELLFEDKQQFIKQNVHENLLKRSKVYPNDVLMNIVGPPLGKFALVTKQYKEWNVNQAIAIFRSKSRILPEFLLYSLMQPAVLKPFLDQAVGIRQLNISLEQCRNIKIPLPDIDEQKEFVCLVEQTTKSKLEIQKSLDKLEILKKSLMQKYFG